MAVTTAAVTMTVGETVVTEPGSARTSPAYGCTPTSRRAIRCGVRARAYTSGNRTAPSLRRLGGRPRAVPAGPWLDDSV
ncbi:MULTISPECIES: hypothetical protein [unclassified Streptomyces]|uniref:hypothetical protein n=1 Tax=unclassified Streptomyces TaxID=2593676 RepID=UPI002DD8EF09|nr:hypothetical protein [Streptomyces sp. NBC_01750]WSB04771.1 hypothetical protein OIE54_39355 [Streptomyces sp. NBC_01794]WSD30949.1 hypothetical protein OG966_02750 [Streptomyces sp. NBC_01750]